MTFRRNGLLIGNPAEIAYTFHKLYRICKGMYSMDIDFALVGSRIREVRNLRGLTSEQLSEIVELSSESLRHIEIGSSKPSLKKLFAIAEALNASLDYLTGRIPTFRESIAADYANGMSLNRQQMDMLGEVVSEMIPIVSRYV